MEIIRMDYCSKCKEKHEHMTFYSKTVNVKKQVERHYYYCHKCNNERGRKYYNENKERCRKIIKRSTKKYQYKQDARIKLNQAIRQGKIEKPDYCSQCGASGRIEGDHDDYSKPYAVTWLCTPCHNLKRVR